MIFCFGLQHTLVYFWKWENKKDKNKNMGFYVFLVSYEHG